MTGNLWRWWVIGCQAMVLLLALYWVGMLLAWVYREAGWTALVLLAIEAIVLYGLSSMSTRAGRVDKAKHR